VSHFESSRGGGEEGVDGGMENQVPWRKDREVEVPV
jgi:hypothetical protein